MIEVVIDFMIILWVILMGLCIHTRRQFKKHSFKLELLQYQHMCLLDYVKSNNSDQDAINAATIRVLKSIVNDILGGDEYETTDRATD